MFKTISSSLILCAAVGMTGCKPNLHKIASKVSKELGIKVKVSAKKDDYCQLQQMQAFWDDYNALPNNAEVRGALHRYDEIDLLPSNIVQTVTGEASYIRIFQDRGAYYYSDSKKLDDSKLIRTGEEPVTVITKDKSLTIQTHASVWTDTVKHNYFTSSRTIFDSVNSLDDTVFANARANRDITVEYDGNMDGIYCGKMAKLTDLF